MYIDTTRRGAARHWIIGCLVVIVIIIGLLAAGGYYISRKVGLGTFDVSKKIDPSRDADADLILPPSAGTFSRIAITSDTAQMALLTSSVPGKHGIEATSGTIVGLYSDAANKSALVLAMDSHEAQHSTQKDNPFKSAGKGDNPNAGFHVQMSFQAVQFGMAGWQKPNWTYAIMTTDTKALDFANGFEPGK